MNQGSSLDRQGLLHLLVVYIVWGSTYLAIRVAVQTGTGFPPFTMAMMRVVTAAALLLGWSRLRGGRIRLDRREFLLLLGTGVLLWVGGNGLVTWSEHGGDRFVAAVENGPLSATQFHPEKSGDAGAQLLRNWVGTLAR